MCAGGNPVAGACSTMSNPASTAMPASRKWNIPPSPSHRIGLPATLARDVLHERGELSGDVSREPIAALLRQPRISGQVHEADRGRLRLVALDTLGVQRSFHVVHGVLGPHVDPMLPVHHDQRPLECCGDAVAELHPELDQFSLGPTGRPKALLDVRLVEFGLCLREPAQGVGVDAEQTKDRLVRHANAPEQHHDVKEREVIFSCPVLWTWGFEPYRLMETLQKRFGNAALLGDVFVGAIESPGCLYARRIEERDRQGFLVDETHDGLGRESSLRPRIQEPRPPELTPTALDRSSLSPPSAARR